MKTSLPSPGFDVRPLLRFRPDSVWLGESRMVLSHSAALSELRNELIKALGLTQARGVLLRSGFIGGQCDARMLRKNIPDRRVEELIRLGPALHGMEGLVRARVTRARIDESRGRFYAEGVWEDSWEDEYHSPGMSGEGPACWNQIGYVSGFCSGLMGKLVVARETACMSQGDPHCALFIQDAESFPDQNYLRYFRAGDPSSRLSSLEAEVAELRAESNLPLAGDGLIGEAKAFRAAIELLGKAAGVRIPVLLLGETGVGKEMFARWLHENSPRAGRRFVAVNCAAIPAELIESELFGVERGAYTGAQSARAGRFERADGGTLFLDEIGDLAPQAQAKLLRVLQTGEVERLGSEGSRKVDVRVVAATHVDLHEAVREKRFRSDLYYRLSAFPISIPPLRERRQDVPALAQAFIERYNREFGKSVTGLSDRALTALRNHDWPGNVRELENVVSRAVLLAPSQGLIENLHLTAEIIQSGAAHAVLDRAGHVAAIDTASVDALTQRMAEGHFTLEQLEAEVLRAAVARAGGKLASAARVLGLTRPQLAYRLKQLERAISGPGPDPD